MHRYTQNTFPNSHLATVQASFAQKRLQLPSGQRVELQVWDTAGQERFHALSPIYYRDANGALVVFDLTDLDSFVRCQRWFGELRTVLDASLPVVLVGNKCDLENERIVQKEQVDKFLEQFHRDRPQVDGIHADSAAVRYIETSAKSGFRIDEIFATLAEMMTKQYNTNINASSLSSSNNNKKASSRRSLIVLDTNNEVIDPAAPPRRSKKCCS